MLHYSKGSLILCNEMMKPFRTLNFRSFRRIGSSAGVGILVNAVILAFLGANLFFRLYSIFDYNSFTEGLFKFLGVCSLFVILFPRYIKVFLFFFGASFFLFGFRSFDIHGQVFETIVVIMALSLTITNMRKGSSGQKNGHLVGLVLCYIGLSAFSLLLLPLGHIAENIRLFGMKIFSFQVFGAYASSYLYSVGGANRLIVFFVFVLGLSSAINSHECYKTLFAGIFGGAVFSAFIGLLDYYGIISLTWYRQVATPGVLHSTFINRGWFCEFILVSVPFVLLGFMSHIKGLWWKIVLLGSLVVCEIALILAGARAGWVSYPLVLFICWLFFYFSKEGRVETFHFRWRDLVKVAVSVPITIVISFFLIFQVLMPLSDRLRNEAGVKGAGGDSKATSQFIKAQAARLVEPKGRIRAWMQGVDVGREKPLLGMGYESFNWQANILSGVSNSYYTSNKDNKHKKILDTPHNTFMQLFVSGGLSGLFMWLVILGYALVLLTLDLVKQKRLLNIPVIISILSFHIYGIFQSMQYISMIWLLIFLNLGYAMTLDESVLPVRVKKAAGILVKACMIMVVVGAIVYLLDSGCKSLAEKYGLSVYAKDQERDNYSGFYGREKWGKEYYRWSGRRGVIRVSGGGVIEVKFVCATPGVKEEPVQLTMLLDGRPLDSISFFQKWPVIRRYSIPERPGDKEHQLFFKVSRTWIPKRYGINEDQRDLGVAVREIRFLKEMPKDGIGFY